MSAYEILDDLFFIERGYLNGNHFVYRSTEPVLIDTAYKSDFEKTAKMIRELGVDLSNVRLIINTHSHGDHVGGNRIIQEKSGCDIAMHRYGKHYIESRDDWSTWWRYYDKNADFFTCTKTLEDGEVVAIGPHEFEVIHTPGHASDGIVLYNRKGRILLSSDTLWEDNLAVMTIRIEGSGSLFAMEESLEIIEALDVRMVYPGHGKPFTDFLGAISMSRKRLTGYIQDRERIGTDLLKKMMIFNLLMTREVEEDCFFPRLMETHWFPESVDLYFGGDYMGKYEEIMDAFLARSIIRRKNGKIFTVVKA